MYLDPLALQYFIVKELKMLLYTKFDEAYQEYCVDDPNSREEKNYKQF